MNTLSELASLDERILRILRAENPETVEQLIQITQVEYPLAKEDLLESILRLETQAKLKLETSATAPPHTLKAYLCSLRAFWYWIIITSTLVTATLVFTVPENAYPVVFTRYIFGAFFVLFLPGFALSKALFPMKGLNNIEQFALGTGISIALAPLVGLLLNFAPGGISTSATTFSLLALTVVLATTGLVREKERLSCPDYQDRW